MRSALLAASRSVWLRERATRFGFVRRAVARFMPGETIDDALDAARQIRAGGITAIVTCLGENVSSAAEADAVADHYIGVLDRIRDGALDVQISVKLTHLGLDLGPDIAEANLARIARHAASTGNRVWIDMEDSSCTGATLDLFRSLRPRHEAIGVCLQAYLRRTDDDLTSLLPLGPSIRLVKGAYKEPAAVAFPRKADVDENFHRLAARLLAVEARKKGASVVFGTHDPVLISRLTQLAASTGAPRETYEFDLLYGIRRDQQEALARDGHRVRVLISYGSFWFPWYMRRLAERPANLWFVARSVLLR